MNKVTAAKHKHRRYKIIEFCRVNGMTSEQLNLVAEILDQQSPTIAEESRQTVTVLKYPHPNETFHQFLSDCGLIYTMHGTKIMQYFRLKNGATINLYKNGKLQIQGRLQAISDTEKKISENLNTNIRTKVRSNN